MRLSQITNPVVADAGWQTEWPDEPGTLWLFFGWPHGKIEGDPELFPLEVWKISGGSLCYVRGGTFMYKQENPIGKFKRIDMSIPTSAVDPDLTR